MTIETSKTPLTNTDLLALTAQQQYNGAQRFVSIGSIARGVRLGYDSDALTDPRRRRFQDVDVIDRQCVLTGKYSVNGGHLDGLHTRTLRPVEADDTLWGFYDTYNPSDLEPLATFPEACLGLSAIHFSASYPDRTIQVPDAATLVALSNLYSHSGLLPKHQDQIQELENISNGLHPVFSDALDTYKQSIEERYPLSAYMKVRRKIFNSHPAFALSVQDGTLSSIGKLIRAYRQSTPIPPEEISFDDCNN